MKTIDEISKYDNFTLNECSGIGGWGFLFLPGQKLPATVIFSTGEAKGWEHVSMSLKNRYPTWKEMCLLKDMFFKTDECVIQFYPAGDLDIYSYRLHLWRNKNSEFEMPPMDLGFGQFGNVQ